MADGQGHQWMVMWRWDEICNEILDVRKLPHEIWSDRIFSLIYSIKIQWWDVQHFLKHIFNYLWAAKNVMLRSRANLTSIITESLSSSGSLPIEPKAPRSKMFHRCIQVISELLPAWVTICHKFSWLRNTCSREQKNVAYERQQTCTSCMYAKICLRLPSLLTWLRVVE